MVLDIQLVSKVTEACNLGCEYCFLDVKSAKRMSENVAEKLISSFLNYNKRRAHFTWIGGEPLLQKDEFFEKLIYYSNKHNSKSLNLTHSIQTNGTLLDSQRLNHLRSLGYKIGVSYDGTDEIQDNLRRRLNGEPSSKKVIEILRRSDKNLGTIAVVTKKSLGKEKEIYDNLATLTKSARLNFYSPVGEGLVKTDDLLPNKEEAASMLISFYELWKNDSSSKFDLYPFYDITRAFFTGLPKTCEFSALSCYGIVGSDTLGNIYTCSRSTHLPETKLGNIFSSNLEEIIGSDRHNLILDRYLHLKESGCKWFSLCSGGCPVEALEHGGDFMNKSYYCCESKGKLYSRIEEDMKDDSTRERLRQRLDLNNSETLRLEKLDKRTRNENFLIYVGDKPLFVLKSQLKNAFREKKVMEFMGQTNIVPIPEVVSYGDNFMITKYIEQLSDTRANDALEEIVRFHLNSLSHKDYSIFQDDVNFCNDKRIKFLRRVKKHPDFINNLWDSPNELIRFTEVMPQDSYSILPKIIVHGDLQKGNIQTDKNGVKIFLDFETAFYDHFTWDLSRAIFDVPLDSVDSFINNYISFIKSHESLIDHKSSFLKRAILTDFIYRSVNDSIGMQQNKDYEAFVGNYLNRLKPYISYALSEGSKISLNGN